MGQCTQLCKSDQKQGKILFTRRCEGCGPKVCEGVHEREELCNSEFCDNSKLFFFKKTDHLRFRKYIFAICFLNKRISYAVFSLELSVSKSIECEKWENMDDASIIFEDSIDEWFHNLRMWIGWYSKGISLLIIVVVFFVYLLFFKDIFNKV